MKKKNFLKEIVTKKKEQIILAKQNVSEEELKNKLAGLSPTRSFLAAINKPRQIALIAEIKRASPSRGLIRENFNVGEITRAYQDSGVQAISVITEENYFQGNISYLQEVRSITELPILRKDFIIEPYQIYESRCFGADAILLIADLFSRETLMEFVTLAAQLGLEALVEVHTEKELKKVLGLKVALPSLDCSPKKVSGRTQTKKLINFAVGINNRDLNTLEVDFKTTERLFPLVTKDKFTVVESGIKSYQDVLFLKILGVNAVLVGEAFMEAQDIGKRVQELMGW
jgi:indole-3-glycerol phosphate synthase